MSKFLSLFSIIAVFSIAKPEKKEKEAPKVEIVELDLLDTEIQNTEQLIQLYESKLEMLMNSTSKDWGYGTEFGNND